MAGLARVGGGICLPFVLLGARLWLGQIVVANQVVPMMTGPAPGLLQVDAAVLQGIGALMLAAGLLTRPVSLAVLATAGGGPLAAALLVWLAVMGPGPVSADQVLGRGLSWVPLRPVWWLHRQYGWLRRHAAPPLQVATRLGLAASLALPGGAALHVSSPALAVLLALGVATRGAALLLAAIIPMAGMSMDDRGAGMLLALLLASAGGGPLAVDWLVARWAGRMVPVPDPAQLPHVVIIGGGFAGLSAARGLRGVACRVTLIDRRNHHLFQPLLYQVATAALSPADIAVPIRSLFRSQPNVSVQLAEVTGINPAARTVQLAEAARDCIRYDHLVVATGARHSYFGRDEWALVAPGLKDLDDATAIRSRLLRAFELAEASDDPVERAACLTFVIVGGGPTGIELAGAIAELSQHGMAQEYRRIDPASARVVLVQSGPLVLPAFSPATSAAAAAALARLGVELRLHARVEEIDAQGVVIAGERLAARTVLWAAGVAASAAAVWLGVPGDRSGRLPVAADLSVPGCPGVYAAGDTAASLGWHGMPVPGLAPAAKQQGAYAARVIRAAIEQRPAPAPFRYRHFGSLATIGRQAAVVEAGRWRMSGEPGWWLWGLAHIAFLVGGRNRTGVLLSWAWNYLTYHRSTRLITGAR